MAEVADGLAEPHTLPLCSYEQSAWHSAGLFSQTGGPGQQENVQSQRSSSEESDDVFVISHAYPLLPVAELTVGIAAMQRSVNLLLQRTTILSLEARGEEVNRQAWVGLMRRVSRLHLRCCRNLGHLSAGVSSRQVGDAGCMS